MLDFSNVKFSHKSKSAVKMMLSLMFFSLHPLLWKLFAHKNATFLGNTTELCMKTIFIIPIMMLDFSNIEVSQESESAVKMMLYSIFNIFFTIPLSWKLCEHENATFLGNAVAFSTWK